MDKKKKNSGSVDENTLTEWLSSTGFLFPRNEVELDRLNCIYENYNYKLKGVTIDPAEIISGNIKHTGKVIDISASVTPNEIEELKMAARNGEKLVPDHILNKMVQKHKKRMAKINKTPEILIQEQAEFLALEYDAFETPLSAIADIENIPLFYDDYENVFDGMLVYDQGFFIHINTHRYNFPDSAKGRFTLAHELGHYFIDNHRIGLQSGLLESHPSKNLRSINQKIEREADHFASCLLMPEIKFKQECYLRKFSFSVLEQLAAKFNVSLSACALRFANIGNHPITVVYSENGNVVWKWNSPDFRHWKLASVNSKVPEDTLAGAYFSTGNGSKRTEQLWAGDWFSCYKYSDENKKIYEHIIPAKNKALSVIWED